MCIWKVVEGDRHCAFCSYYGGCEVREVVVTVEEMGDKYVSVLSSILGRDIRERSRERMLVWCRNMAFYQLVKDGYTLWKIGSYMGFDHATVLHGKKQVENMLNLPGMYREEYGIWLKFQKSIGLC